MAALPSAGCFWRSLLLSGAHHRPEGSVGGALGRGGALADGVDANIPSPVRVLGGAALGFTGGAGIPATLAMVCPSAELVGTGVVGVVDERGAGVVCGITEKIDGVAEEPAKGG